MTEGSRFKGWLTGAGVLLVLTVLFALQYFHAFFEFQGDVPFSLYLHHNRELLRAGWDPYTWGYMGWYPVAGHYFPPTMVMHAVLDLFKPDVSTTLTALQIYAAVSLFLLGFCTYIFLRYLQRSQAAALIGAMLVEFAGFHVHAGFRELDVFYLHSFMFVPLTFLFLIEANRRRSLVSALTAGLMIGLSLLSGGNTPMFYFVPLFPFAGLVDESPRSFFGSFRWIRGFGFAVAAVLAGVAVGARMVLPSLGLMGLTDRLTYLDGLNVAGIKQSYSVMVLVFREWWVQNGYFNHEWDFFVGLPPLALMALSWGGKERVRGRLFFMICLLAGCIFVHASILPGFLKTWVGHYFTLQSIRSYPRFFLVVIFALSFLAAAGFDRLKRTCERAEPVNPTAVYAWIGITVVYLFVLASYFSNSLYPGQVTAVRATLVLTAAFSLLLVRCRMRRKLGTAEQILFVALIFASFYFARPDTPVRTNYLGLDIQKSRVPVKRKLNEQYAAPVKQYAGLLSPDGQNLLRVFRPHNLANRENFWGPASRVGIAFEPRFDPATPRSLVPVIDTVFNPENRSLINLESRWLDVYNVRYMSLSGYDGKKWAQTQTPGVFENPEAFDRFYLVHGARVFPTDREAQNAVSVLPKEDLRQYVYLSADAGTPGLRRDEGPRNTLEERVHVREYRPGRIWVDAQLNRRGYLVASELWFPLWKVAIDGRRAPLLKAFGTFWAVELEAGTHDVRFEMSDPYAFWGGWISAASLFLIAAVIWFARRAAPSPRASPHRPAETVPSQT